MTSLRPVALALGLLALVPLAACEYRPVLPTAATPAVTGGSPATNPPPAPSPPDPQPPAPPPHHGAPLRMLFIGNSLTYVNDLPAMVTAIASAAGDTIPIETRMVAFGGYALEDHIAQGDAARAIAEGGWDFVVLQQGPSSLPESRTNLIQYTQVFATLIRNAGAQPALYGVWPEAERIDVIDDCIESYRQAAAAVDGTLFPAALAWKLAWRHDASLPLYGPDRFHPSLLGTYTAALVIYAVARDRTPIGLPAIFDLDGTRVFFGAHEADVAQQGAAEAIGRVEAALRR